MCRTEVQIAVCNISFPESFAISLSLQLLHVHFSDDQLSAHPSYCSLSASVLFTQVSGALCFMVFSLNASNRTFYVLEKEKKLPASDLKEFTKTSIITPVCAPDPHTLSNINSRI